MSRSLLLICRRAPWSGPGAREALDIALAGGAFDLPIALLFLDDGVLQLAPGQRPTALEQKDLAANLRALPMFGVDELYACADSLAARGIAAADTQPSAQCLDSAGLRALLARFDQVITL